MMPMLHTGFERMHFDPGWSNQGGDTTLLRMICSSHRHVAPMTLINSMIYSGVFERFPTLTLLLAEVGTGWLPVPDAGDRRSGVTDGRALPREVEPEGEAERVPRPPRQGDAALRRATIRRS